MSLKSYSFTESLLSGNSASAVAKDTVTGGVAGGITERILAGAGYGIQKGVSAIENAVKGGTTPAKTDPAKSVLDGACFIAGTFVLTSLGLKTIESIRLGDKVLAADPETGCQEEKKVVRTFVKETDTLVHLVVEGEEIVTTETHPFYVEGKGWTPAGELTEEDYVLDSNNKRIWVESKYLERLEESVKVYNFEVEDFHTYYVGQTGVLVHNKCFEESGNTVSNSTKKGEVRNPNGRKGGEAHRNKINEIEKNIKTRGMQTKTEYRIDTTGGKKNNRYEDIVALEGDTVIENHQVGRQLKSKDLPVKRERDALEDIMNSKEHKGKTYYHSYEGDMKLEVTKNSEEEIEYRKVR